jgi:hypothetical protein
MMPGRELRTRPFSQSIGEESVSATLLSEPSANFWAVTVVISRRPNQPAVDGLEVDAELFDSKGQATDLVERPTGPLTEAGTSLASSVNAVFKFRYVERPAKLVVSYRGGKAMFEIDSQ